MEIRNIVRGETVSFAATARTAEKEELEEVTSQPAAETSTDRVELSCQWLEQMEQQRAQILSLLDNGQKQEGEDEGGLLGYMKTEEEKLDGLSEALDIQMKCLKIAMNMMKGKKVPPEDERYLMEHDPNGYKVAIAMKALVKEDKKECKSVLDDEDKNGDKTEESSDSGEPAPTADSGSAVSSGDSGAVE